ncbi:MAG: hypothetical protein ACLFUF_04525 [Opitutales bacterium]
MKLRAPVYCLIAVLGLAGFGSVLVAQSGKGDESGRMGEPIEKREKVEEVKSYNFGGSPGKGAQKGQKQAAERRRQKARQEQEAQQSGKSKRSQQSGKSKRSQQAQQSRQEKPSQRAPSSDSKSGGAQSKKATSEPDGVYNFGGSPEGEAVKSVEATKEMHGVDEAAEALEAGESTERAQSSESRESGRTKKAEKRGSEGEVVDIVDYYEEEASGISEKRFSGSENEWQKKESQLMERRFPMKNWDKHFSSLGEKRAPVGKKGKNESLQEKRFGFEKKEFKERSMEMSRWNDRMAGLRERARIQTDDTAWDVNKQRSYEKMLNNPKQFSKMGEKLSSRDINRYQFRRNRPDGEVPRARAGRSN